MLLLAAVTGCHPTQPFYFQNDGDLSSYLDAATQIEYPDVEHSTSPEVTDTLEPLHLRNLKFAEYRDLTLQEAVAIALHNSKVIRSAAQFQQFGFASTGASRVLGAGTVLDPAISETLTTPTPLQVDSQGNRIISRGAVRASTVGGYADALAEFDAQMFSSFSYSNTDRPRNVGPGNVFNPVIGQGHDSSHLLALSKKMASGGIITARQTLAYSENNTAIGVGRAVPSDWTAAWELEFTHPLLRQAGVTVNRLPILLARIRTDTTLADFEVSVRDFVKDVENAYWDLHCAYRIVDANKQGRDAALAAWRKDRTRAGKKDPGAQEPRSNGQYLRFRARYDASLAAATQGEGLLVLERKLRGLLGLTATDNFLLRPTDEPSAAFVSFNWDEVKLETLFRSPEIRRQKWQVKQADLEFVSARNQLLPELNLGMRYRILGVGDDLISADRRGANFETTPTGSLAFDGLTEGNFTEALMTLTFQPNAVGARRAHARVQGAMLQIKKAKIQLDEVEHNIEHQLSNSYANLHNQYQLAQIAYGQWVAAEDEVNKLEVRLDVDERLHDQLLDAFDRRASARIEYYQRLCDYNKAIADVHYVKGSLLEFNGVSLAEGPWPQKAYWDALGRARERDASYYLDYGSTRPRVISQGAVPQGVGPGPGAIEGEVFEGEAIIEGEVIEGDGAMPGYETIEPAPIMEPPAPEPNNLPTPAGNGVPSARRSGPSLNAPTADPSGASAVERATYEASGAFWNSRP
ncbi:MAG: hypothetical protein KDB14_08445 [Planctomycetales bacterium]|nr:hypothetical protein [Planctomycetales bacterium]